MPPDSWPTGPDARTAPRHDRPRPNLFVVGAMKSGTSALHRYLAAHPSVFMCEPKEPSFFVDAGQLESVVCHDEDEYLDLFAAAGSATVVGDASTNYAKLPRFAGAAGRIFEFNPGARIVYVMRDPVERTISHYWHAVRHHTETRDVLAAVTDEPHYVDVSNYAMQLTPYLERFGERQVLAFTAEEMASRPVRCMRGVFEFLDVDAGFEPAGAGRRVNVTGQVVRRARGAGLLRRVHGSATWQAVSPRVPRPIRRLGRRLAEREVDRGAVPLDEVIAYLRALQRPQAAELAELLGRTFPEWQTLWGRSAALQ